MTFRAPTPLPRRLARRAHRHLSLPASRVQVFPVDGGVHLDVADRAGVWFSPEEWARFALDVLGVVFELAGDAMTPAERAQFEAALTAAGAAGRGDGR